AEDGCAKTIVSTVARRAFRRPLTSLETGTLLNFYQTGKRDGGFEAGIGRAIERILIDPDFLFRIERSPRGPADRYLALASRLSFFLWSSIPDDRLLDLAERGQLGRPRVLEAEIQRMLADPRSRALQANFFGQWLQTRNVRAMTPDPKAFPEFDENLRAA